MRAAVFLGPTLHGHSVELPTDILLRPPAAMGDLWLAAQEGCRILGLIDGRFGDVPSPWHQEILAVLDRGVIVLGAASMGALRAAELDTLGMIGIGRVYGWFKSGDLDSDDEVAIVHGPADARYVPGSEALVDIRATLEAARAAGRLATHELVLLIDAMRRTWFPERTRARLVERASDLLGPERAGEVRRICAADWVSVKAEDAQLLIAEVGRLLRDPPPTVPASHPFEETLLWRAARQSLRARPTAAPQAAQVSETAMPSWFDRSPLVAHERRPWAISIYVAADNNLEDEVGGDIDELRGAGSSPNVHVAGQVHVPDTSVSARFLIGPKAHEDLRAPIDISPFGPRDSGNPATLTGFLEWSLAGFQADRRVLVLWGHGRGLSVLGDDTDKNWIDLDELGGALATAGLGTDRRLAILGFDACMMATVECLSESAPFAEWIVASQQVVPDVGWAYGTLLDRLVADVPRAGEFGRLVVDSYVAGNAERRHPDVDMTLLDGSIADDLATALGAFGTALLPLLAEHGRAIDSARMLSRTFRNGDLVDVGDVVRRIVDACDDTRLRRCADRVLVSMGEAVVHARSIAGFAADGAAVPDERRYGLSVFWPRIAGVWQRSRTSYCRMRFARTGGAGWVRFLDALLQPRT